VGVPWPLVDVLEEGRDGILLALGFALDLEQYRQFIIFSFGLSFIFCLSFLYYRMA
jgi:phosphoglycerol transferase MdoB-like AlkP superfamily enzyme